MSNTRMTDLKQHGLVSLDFGFNNRRSKIGNNIRHEAWQSTYGNILKPVQNTSAYVDLRLGGVLSNASEGIYSAVFSVIHETHGVPSIDFTNEYFHRLHTRCQRKDVAPS